MSPELIATLVQFGPIGLVIIVVIAFLKYLENRDQTYAESSRQTAEAINKAVEILSGLTAKVDGGFIMINQRIDSHDEHVDQRISVIEQKAAAVAAATAGRRAAR